MKIFSNDSIRKILTSSATHDSLTRLELMERAASASAYEIASRWKPSKRVVVFAGPGCNGGDALIVARILQEQGYFPEVFLFNIQSSHLSKECKECRDRLLEMPDVNFTEVVNQFMPPELGFNDLVVDGLFGSGLNRPLAGGFTSLVQYINSSGAFVVSLDVPSGLFGEWNSGNDRRNVVKAHLTLTYQFKRLSFFMAENAEYVGECEVLDLDLNPHAQSGVSTDFYMIEREDVRDSLRLRNPFANKYDHGALYLVAGSYGMMGAAILAARGALRAGVGVVTVHAPSCGCTAMHAACPEALFEADRNELSTSEIIPGRHRYSVVALGPGMGVADETVLAVDEFLKKYKNPCLLDADALNCIVLRQQLLRSIPKGSIITPHAGEFDRLFAKNNEHLSDEERLQKAIDVSKIYKITIVLKGRYTKTVRPDGKVYINSSGNPGMATAGSGDVLTGVISGLIAQGYAPDMAVVMGVYIHGHAGDMAAETHGQHGMIASDIAEHIGKAIADIKARN